MVPLRQCIACRAMKPKIELIRVTKTKDKSISIDLTNRVFGRGAYVCLNINCIEKAQKTKKLSKHFKQEISSDLYEELKSEILKQGAANVISGGVVNGKK